jgi:hypothetical protein
VGNPSNWSSQGDKNVAEWLRAAGHVEVVRTMRAFPENAVIQERGLQQLMTVVIDEIAFELSSTDAVNAAGGAAAAVEAMGAHKKHKGIQTFGCRLLMNLSCSERCAEIAMHIVARRLVLTTAGAFSHRCAETSGPTAAKRAVLVAGGMQVVLNAVDAYPDEEDLVLPAFKGLAYARRPL